jgi:hypothetical protein
MKKITIAALFVLTSFSMLASQKRKVLIFGLDGFRSDALQLAKTPNMDALIATGVYTYDSWNMGITVSGPSWSTIFTGVWHQKHGVTDNSYAGSNYNQYPYFLTRAKQVKPNLYGVQVVTWSPMSDQVYNDGYDKKLVRPNDFTQWHPAVEAALQDPNIDVMVAYTNYVDGVGHSTGFSPSNSAYIKGIEDIDGWVGAVMADVKKRPTYADEDWLILLVTDHGGLGTSHGGNSDEERHIWWIASGNNVKPKQIFASDPGSYVMSNNPVDPTKVANVPVQSDIAVTALHHLLYDAGVRPDDKSKLPGSAWNLDGKSLLDSIFTPKSNDTSTGIGNTSAVLEMKIYPNPATNLVTLWLDPQGQPVSYTITNVSGQIVKAEKDVVMNHKLNIDITGQEPGNYFISVQAGGKKAVQQILFKP